MRALAALLLLLLPPSGALTVQAAAAPETSYDLILRNGTIVDGSGDLRFRADIGIRNGRISRIGALPNERAETELDVKGLFVTPGFINIHSHASADGLPYAVNMLTQGVTTEIINADGWGTIDVPSQLKEMSSGGLAVNIGAYVGFNVVWQTVIGSADRRATSSEIARMREMIAGNLCQGVWGLSAGLDYKPAYYADTDEVIAVASAAAPWRTIFQNHERLVPEKDYSSLSGIAETIAIGERAGLIPVITHMKVQGAEQQRSQEALDMIDEATRRGHYTAGDIYPYLAGQNDVRSLLIPAWALEGGEDALYARYKDPAQRARMIVDIERAMDLRFGGAGGVFVSGKRRELTDIMSEWKVSAGEAIIRLNEESRGNLPETFLRFGAEEDVLRMLRHPSVAVACDCGARSKLEGHPRNFGSFPRVLGHYVRSEGALTWEEAIRKMTGLPATLIGVTDRGFVTTGMIADITVFDPQAITDKATYEIPRLSDGVRHVLVNGKLALRSGKPTGVQSGRIISRSENMLSRPMSYVKSATITGSSFFKAGKGHPIAPDTSRLQFRIEQKSGVKAPVGSMVLTGKDSRPLFQAFSFGMLQVYRDWASVTGIGHTATGEELSFSLIIDRDRSPSYAKGSLVLSIEKAGPLVTAKVDQTKIRSETSASRPVDDRSGNARSTPAR